MTAVAMAWSLYNTPEEAWDGPPAERVATPDVSNNLTATATPGAPMTENIAPVATAVPNAVPTAIPAPAPKYPDPKKLAEICNMGVCGASLLAMLLWQLARAIPVVRSVPQDRTKNSCNPVVFTEWWNGRPLT